MDDDGRIHLSSHELAKIAEAAGLHDDYIDGVVEHQHRDYVDEGYSWDVRPSEVHCEKCGKWLGYNYPSDQCHLGECDNPPHDGRDGHAVGPFDSELDAASMRPTSVVETLGSVWYIDDEAKLYVRTPRNEGPRRRGPNGEDWGGPGAPESLQDGIPHPFDSWSVVLRYPYGFEHDHDECPHLVIEGPGIKAPHAIVILDSSF